MTTIAERGSRADIDRLHALFDAQKRAFARDMMPSWKVRVDRLKRLERMMVTNQPAIEEAVTADFGCHAPVLTRLLEVMPTVLRARYARAHLRRWMRPQSRPVHRLLFGLARNYVVCQPRGVVGNLSPWNFPIDLACGPLVDILAAGNRAILKPSESTPLCSALLSELVAGTFDEEEVAVVNGGVEVAEAFCRLPWDHLLFTGGQEIGKKVMRAASENLTPVTLELGGKNPTIFADDALDEGSVRYLVMAKMIKAGQMCVSPDYVFVPHHRVDDFVHLARGAMARLYPRVIDNPDAASIINDHHYQRLVGYLRDAAENETPVIDLDPAGEGADPQRRKLPLSLVIDPADDRAVMRDEIFGPILPVKPYRALDEVIAYINERPRPLALYLFTHDRKTTARVLQQTISGGVSLNAASAHGLQASLPFGGVGASGMGHHHGYEGFLNFSKVKPVFQQARLHASSVFYPPYSELMARILRFILGG